MSLHASNCLTAVLACRRRWCVNATTRLLIHRALVSDHLLAGQGTFGRLYKAHLRVDLPVEQLPQWVHSELQRKRAREGEPHSGASAASSAANSSHADTSNLAALREAMLVIKEVPFDGLPPQEQQDILNEVRVMSAVNHSAFIAYYESFLDNGCLYIVMELASGGDLGQLLTASKPNPLTENEIWRYLLQLLEGLSYLHASRILHRDIKPANIFLDAAYNVKIGDLGLGRILGSKTAMAKTNLGTPLYFSPELCLDQPYDEKSDVWALGCLLYEMATFSPPFMASNQIALAKKIVHDQPVPLPNSLSSELRFLVQKMLEKEPSKRPSIDQMLQYSPVKLRIENRDLKYANERWMKMAQGHEAEIAQVQSMQQAEIAQLKRTIQQDQQKHSQQLQQAQQQYEQVYSLLQSAETAHSTIVAHVYSLEADRTTRAESDQQLFEQYQMQLARGEQERKQLESKMQQQEQQMKHHQSNLQALYSQIDQLKLTNQQMQQQQQQQQRDQPHYQPKDHKESKEAVSSPVASSPSTDAGIASPPLTAVLPQAALMTVSSSSPILSPIPLKSTSPALPMFTSALTSAASSSSVLTSPQSSPAIVKTNARGSRTPYLGPAVRVPIGQPQKEHVSPVKLQGATPATANPSTVTPRKRTPTSARMHPQAAPTPIPKLEWNHSPQKPTAPHHHAPSSASSAYHPSAYEQRSRSASNVSRTESTPGLDHSDSELTDDSFDGSTPIHNSSIYFHPSNPDSPGSLPRATLTPHHPLYSARDSHVSSAEDWTARLSAAASGLTSGTTSPGAISPTSGMASPRFPEKAAAHHEKSKSAWPLNSQQLQWLMNEAEQYDMHAQ